MDIKYIVLNINCGEDIDDIVVDAIKLAKKYDTTVKFNFNGENLEVYQTTDKKSFVKKYLDKIKRKS